MNIPATIWKYEMNGVENQTIKMPKYAVIKAVQVQNEKICIWAEFMPEFQEVLQDRRFTVITTGQTFNCKGLIYYGTLQLDNGNFVGHVHEIFYED